LAVGTPYETAAGEAFVADHGFDPAPALARLLRAGLVIATQSARAGTMPSAHVLEETP
jgi:hypothetical protein